MTVTVFRVLTARLTVFIHSFNLVPVGTPDLSELLDFIYFLLHFILQYNTYAVLTVYLPY